MVVSTKGRYALRVMIDLAEHQKDGYIPLRAIAERQGISEKYLEAILKVLVQAGYLTGLRGKGGGYRLSRSPRDYTAADIVRLTEGGLAAVSCLEEGSAQCARWQECRTLPMWKELDRVIWDCLSRYTVADLMVQPPEAEKAE